MSLLTYFALPKKLTQPSHDYINFYINDVLSCRPNFITSRCFENKFIYSLESRLDYCPYKIREIEYNGNFGFESLSRVSLRNRGSLEFLIRYNLNSGEFLEIYSIWWGHGVPDELPTPEYTIVMHIDDLQESRNFVLDDGYKFIIHR